MYRNSFLFVLFVLSYGALSWIAKTLCTLLEFRGETADIKQQTCTENAQQW